LNLASLGISSQVQVADQNDKVLHMELGLNKTLIKKFEVFFRRLLALNKDCYHG
jgi:hypothetical protein